jgi:multicomponent K+:H+ antiporter subunit A
MLLAIVLLPFIGSLCAAFLPRSTRNTAALISGSVVLATAAVTASLVQLKTMRSDQLSQGGKI